MSGDFFSSGQAIRFLEPDAAAPPQLTMKPRALRSESDQKTQLIQTNTPVPELRTVTELQQTAQRQRVAESVVVPQPPKRPPPEALPVPQDIVKYSKTPHKDRRKELHSIYELDLISEEEFEAKRKKLLDSL